MSLVDVCATCLRCHLWYIASLAYPARALGKGSGYARLVYSLVIEVQLFQDFFMNFKKNLKKMRNAYFLCSKQTFYIIRMPISYSTSGSHLFSSILHYIFFLWLQRSIGQPKVIF